MSAFRALADGGNAAAQYELGILYLQGQGTEQDLPTAIQWIQKAAEQDYLQAELQLALTYGRGVYAAQDYATALKWFRRAASQGDASAQYNLGLMTYSGQGVPSDHAAAAAWYRKAAEQGETGSAMRLARMYRDGDGVPQNDATAADYAKRAAGRGVVSGEVMMGDMYRAGKGVPRNYATAADWYRKAAQIRNPAAFFGLGQMALNGQGVPADKYQAYVWFERAAVAGSSDAIHARDQLAAQLTADQILRAKQEAGTAGLTLAGADLVIADPQVQAAVSYRKTPDAIVFIATLPKGGTIGLWVDSDGDGRWGGGGYTPSQPREARSRVDRGYGNTSETPAHICATYVYGAEINAPESIAASSICGEAPSQATVSIIPDGDSRVIETLTIPAEELFGSRSEAKIVLTMRRPGMRQDYFTISAPWVLTR